jgi:hypothetical protein
MQSRVQRSLGLRSHHNEYNQRQVSEGVVNCPKCDGKGVVLVTPKAKQRDVKQSHFQPAQAAQMLPCTYEGCHAGQVHCCDPTEGGE